MLLFSCVAQAANATLTYYHIKIHSTQLTVCKVPPSNIDWPIIA